MTSQSCCKDLPVVYRRRFLKVYCIIQANSLVSVLFTAIYSFSAEISIFQNFSLVLGSFKNISNLSLNLDMAMTKPMIFTTNDVTAFFDGRLYCPLTNPNKMYVKSLLVRPRVVSLTNVTYVCLSECMCSSYLFRGWRHSMEQIVQIHTANL